MSVFAPFRRLILGGVGHTRDRLVLGRHERLGGIAKGLVQSGQELEGLSWEADFANGSGDVPSLSQIKTFTIQIVSKQLAPKVRQTQYLAYFFARYLRTL